MKVRSVPSRLRSKLTIPAALRTARAGVRTAALLAVGFPMARRAGAQPAAPLSANVVIAPAWQSWRFAKDIPLDSLLVKGATQISVPFAVQFPLGSRWNASITGAFASSKLDARTTEGDVTRTFSGMSDVRVRASGRLIGDALQLTLGVNVPTGAVNLDPEQNDVIQVTAAPALDARVPIAGTGLGGTVGLIFAHYIGQWAWALGAGIEQRGTYAPLDAQIAGLQSRTELDPGGAAHFSIGADGLVGANRLSLGVVTDIYGSDELHLTAAGNEPVTAKYKLGPTVSGALALQVGNSAVRDLTFRINDRYRTGFRDGNGNDVDGSSGNYLNVGATGLVGAPNRPSLLLGLNVRQHTGLPVDKGFIGAGLTAVDATIGASIPVGALNWQPSVQFMAGSLKTELVTSGITGLTAGLTITRR
jgi:hypothetical protein